MNQKSVNFDGEWQFTTIIVFESNNYNNYDIESNSIGSSVI